MAEIKQQLSPQEERAKKYEKSEAKKKRRRARIRFRSLVYNMTGKFLWELVLAAAIYYTFLGVWQVSLFDVLQGRVMGLESVAYSINLTVLITAVVFLAFSALTWPRAYGEYAAYKKEERQRMPFWFPIFALLLGLFIIAAVIIAGYFILNYLRPEWIAKTCELINSRFSDSILIRWYSR